MRDITGIELKEGDFIEVRAGNEWLPCTIQKIDESALLMPPKPGQLPITKLTVVCDFNIPTLNASAPQMVVRRIPHPDYERIVPKAN